MITPGYDPLLILASVLVSIMAAFSGLQLTRGISALPAHSRKLMIVMAALCLGGGIWSMHFVAMLAMRWPIEVSYDAAFTLGSMLIAILLTGLALLIVHFAGRAPAQLLLAGLILGNGILVMHLVGMLGIRGLALFFAPQGVILAALAASILGVLAIWLAYRQRTGWRIFGAALLFGASVALVHFLAMHWTSFSPSANRAASTPLVGHGILALLVMLSAFVICGTFLLTAANFVFPSVTPRPNERGSTAPLAPAATRAVATGPALASSDPGEPLPVVSAPAAPETAVPLAPTSDKTLRLPYEREKRTYFIAASEVAAVRAEGHYSLLYCGEDKLFCPFAISELERRLPADQFIKTHRSYLVNIAKVLGFERRKDNGVCLLDGVASLKAVPVSRGFLPEVRSALGL